MPFAVFQRGRSFGLTAIICLLLGLFAGCTSQVEKRCTQGDWRAIGLADGAAGKRAIDSLQNHVAACAQYNTTPDRNRYQAGYAEGIARYCSEPGGYAAGKAGQQYSGACSASGEKRFMAGYRDGLGYFCSVENGYQTGNDGKPYDGQCPDEVQPAFLSGYISGLESKLSSARFNILEAKTELSSLTIELDRQESELESAERRWRQAARANDKRGQDRWKAKVSDLKIPISRMNSRRNALKSTIRQNERSVSDVSDSLTRWRPVWLRSQSN